MALSKEEFTKALEARQGKELTEKFASSSVAVCGLGGLGSNIAISLARAGVGKLFLIDFDRVDISNLHRQQYRIAQIGKPKTEALAENIREFAPYTELVLIDAELTEENIETLLKNADIVCEAFDKAEAKAMLVNTVLEKMPEKYLVAASGMAGLSGTNKIKTKKINEHFYVSGDFASEVSEEGLFSTRVMLCAAHEAHTVLEIIANRF